MRKSAPIRQLSLHVETPPSRKHLKKQFSEDIPDSKEKLILELDPYVSVCAKNLIKNRDNPLPVKQAWMENSAQQFLLQSANHTTTNDEGIIAKKCKEIKRPLTSKVIKQSSMNKDSILLSHQELAERLRQAWKDREKEKQNLNIFLTHNMKEKQEEEFCSDLTDSECTTSTEKNASKTPNKQKNVLHLQPDPSVNESYKSIFQKRMRRTHSVDETRRDFLYSPSSVDELKSKSVVVVPLIESMKLQESQVDNNPKPEFINKPKFQNKNSPCDFKNDETKPSKPIFEENKPINVIIRPMTATLKRDAFRSRVSSAFNTSNASNIAKENPRPPLIRSSSVPLKQISPKPNFVAVKRRLKSASKKKDKNVQITKGELVDETDENGKWKNRKLQRCVSASGPDIITMVSLISPEESEAEEPIEADKSKPTSTTAPVSKTASVEKSEKVETTRNYNLRKTVKSVSFQQSSIHAVRSFSASFPARRGSVVTTLMLNNSNLDKSTNHSSIQEKRGTLESSSDDVREPKRRLLRTKSIPLYSSTDELEDGGPTDTPVENSNNNCISHSQGNCKDTALIENEIEPSSSPSCSTKLEESEKTENVKHKENLKNDLAFETPKEKQCWEMYRKMSGKGITISFETILRGMLTPTEYRLRRKSTVALETNNTGDSTTDS